MDLGALSFPLDLRTIYIYFLVAFFFTLVARSFRFDPMSLHLVGTF